MDEMKMEVTLRIDGLKTRFYKIYDFSSLSDPCKTYNLNSTTTLNERTIKMRNENPQNLFETVIYSAFFS